MQIKRQEYNQKGQNNNQKDQQIQQNILNNINDVYPSLYIFEQFLLLQFIYNIMDSLNKKWHQRKAQSIKQEGIEIINSLNKFFKKCAKQNLQMGDDGQTYQQFLEMKGIQPNQQGTGRLSFSQIKQIQCLFIKKQKKKYQSIKINQQFKSIIELLSTFLAIPTKFLDYQLELNEGTIIDKKRNLEYKISRNLGRFNALQILDLLTEYKSQSKLLIAFIQNDLHQEESDIYGRACGDGVAVIDFNLINGNKKEIQKFYQTCIHETLHTLGFDHCLAWACLMNPIVAEQLWLCPECIKKIMSQLQIQIEQWAQNLSNLYSKYFPLKGKTVQKSLKIINLIKQSKKIKIQDQL